MYLLVWWYIGEVLRGDRIVTTPYKVSGSGHSDVVSGTINIWPVITG